MNKSGGGGGGHVRLPHADMTLGRTVHAKEADTACTAAATAATAANAAGFPTASANRKRGI